MKHQVIIKIGDTPIPTLQQYKDRIAQWKVQADSILLAQPYTKQQMSRVIDDVLRYSKYQNCKKITQNRQLSKKYTPIQIAKMMQYINKYAVPTPQQLAELIRMYQVRPHVIWALGIVNQKDKWSDSQISDYLNIHQAINPKDGDVLHFLTPQRCKQVWDQMLDRGRVTRKRYSDAQLPDGTFKWPYGKQDLYILQGFSIDDSFSDLQRLSIIQKQIILDVDPLKPPEITKFRKNSKIDIQQVTYYSNTTTKRQTLEPTTIADMKDMTKQVEVRYDKPILKSQILDKSQATQSRDLGR